MNKIYSLFIVCLVLLGCGGNGTTSVGNPTGAVITIGRLTDEGKSTLTFPLAIFEASRLTSASSFDSSDPAVILSGTSIDIFKNGTALASVTDLYANYYSEDLDAVRFVLSSLADGDELAFVITHSDGSSETYEGTVSDTADTEATSDDATATSGIRPTADGYMIYTDLSSAYEGVYVPASGSCFRSGVGDWEAFYVVENGADVLADFLEDQEEDSVTFSDSTSASFSTGITNQVEDPGDPYAWTIDCDFNFSVGTITGTCEVADVADGVGEVTLGDTCEVEYVLCDSLSAEDYFNSSTLHAGYSTQAELDALDACYAAN